MLDQKRDEVFSKVKAIIEEAMYLKDKTVDLTTHVVNDLGAESMDVVCIQMGLEDEFGGEVPPADMAKLLSVSDIVDYIIHRSATNDAVSNDSDNVSEKSLAEAV